MRTGGGGAGRRGWAIALALALAGAACEPEEGDVAAPPVPGPAQPEAEPPAPDREQESPAQRDAAARGAPADEGCDALPSADELRRLLREAPDRGDAGGLFGGRKAWAATVNRQGEVCTVVVSTDDAADAWPGSQSIAKAKAYTANAFSTDAAPLSTARLYTLAQPGHSLYGIAAGNPLHADCMAKPEDHEAAERRVCGGTIAFGGGVPLYRDGRRAGGLGVSGDTACADHEIAKRIRGAAGLDPPGGPTSDDITFADADGPSPFAHPLCPNTIRNGQALGDEAPGS